MSGVSHRNPGVAQAILMSKETYAELICDFIHISPETIKFTIQNKGVNKITCITDAIRPAGLPDGEYTSGNLLVNKKGLMITLKKEGSIAGSGATMHANFLNLLSLGYSINDVVKMTSYNITQNMKLKNVGQIKVGYSADMVFLDKINNINKVYINGKEI
jgi:N-acetylglucosamine-6-phosphate deacetylase